MAKEEKATFGGGCFWCLQAVYERMDGVRSVESGYMGGHTENPTYGDVCSGTTGHVEVVQVVFDPAITTYQDLLDVFFAIHDPTTRDRQGNDIGSQYRSVIFYHSDAQRAAGEQAIRELDASGTLGNPVVTEVQSASRFYKAEEYHQQYFENNPQQPYCAYVVSPKVQKFREKFAKKFRAAG